MTKINRLEIFKAMIGESHSEFVADSLQETYDDLNNEIRLIENDESRTPIWSYNDAEELENIYAMLEALELVHSWYSTEDLKCSK